MQKGDSDRSLQRNQTEKERDTEKGHRDRTKERQTDGESQRHSGTKRPRVHSRFFVSHKTGNFETWSGHVRQVEVLEKNK